MRRPRIPSPQKSDYDVDKLTDEVSFISFHSYVHSFFHSFIHFGIILSKRRSFKRSLSKQDCIKRSREYPLPKRSTLNIFQSKSLPSQTRYVVCNVVAICFETSFLFLTCTCTCLYIFILIVIAFPTKNNIGDTRDSEEGKIISTPAKNTQ